MSADATATAARTEAAEELTAMLDDGVSVEIADVEAGVYELRLSFADSACADCLVPEPTLIAIATDALERRGAPVTTMTVQRPA
ncbi:hypothetical protein E4P41_00480 [Geodermatophilus sp. DF01-2]|uniref:hypothetical protein n=1 Tax=Geodermatophilus sp. DF01-2 TaxID=2559610 RepID=UPI0010741049|nr:hypothetical protein [Geodermatophilus sp. DF01_2]TFV64751.1 hypothetical protein E4P41_00480 [Geodermatophilus sp. DF01_2]